MIRKGKAIKREKKYKWSPEFKPDTITPPAIKMFDMMTVAKPGFSAVLFLYTRTLMIIDIENKVTSIAR